jgi:drug/metabolite transporter (DMT)-like permease
MLAYQLRLHLIVLIFGFTGILGKLIDLPAELIVLYRMSIACAAIAIFIKFNGHPFRIEKKDLLKWLSTGFIVGLHWFFFFESIKQSTVSVALVSLSSTALFTSLLEPLLYRKPLKWYEVIFSLLIIIGMTIVLRFEFRYVLGIFYGVLCAFLASLFTVLNSRFVVNHRSTVISFYELLGGVLFIFLLVSLFRADLLSIMPSGTDLIYLLLLGIVATAVAFVVSIGVMKKLSPFTVSLTINLEPLYGIILAVIIFGQEELMSAGFYIGFVLILLTILINAVIKRRARMADEIPFT